jgi:hypothetical protein
VVGLAWPPCARAAVHVAGVAEPCRRARPSKTGRVHANAIISAFRPPTSVPPYRTSSASQTMPRQSAMGVDKVDRCVQSTEYASRELGGEQNPGSMAWSERGIVLQNDHAYRLGLSGHEMRASPPFCQTANLFHHCPAALLKSLPITVVPLVQARMQEWERTITTGMLWVKWSITSQKHDSRAQHYLSGVQSFPCPSLMLFAAEQGLLPSVLKAEWSSPKRDHEPGAHQQRRPAAASPNSGLAVSFWINYDHTMLPLH